MSIQAHIRAKNWGLPDQLLGSLSSWRRGVVGILMIVALGVLTVTPALAQGGSTGERNGQDDNVTLTFQLTLEGEALPEEQFNLSYSVSRTRDFRQYQGKAFCGGVAADDLEESEGVTPCAAGGSKYSLEVPVPRGAFITYELSRNSVAEVERSGTIGKATLQANNALTLTKAYSFDSRGHSPSSTPRTGGGGTAAGDASPAGWILAVLSLALTVITVIRRRDRQVRA